MASGSPARGSEKPVQNPAQKTAGRLPEKTAESGINYII